MGAALAGTTTFAGAGLAFGVGLFLAAVFGAAAFTFEAGAALEAFGFTKVFPGLVVVFFAMNECETDT
ncbi:MAG: hypothetical protein ACRC3B_03415 [Bacteroidia bacterium]